MSGNLVLDRVYVRLTSALETLSAAAEGIEDRDSVTPNELADLKHDIAAAARSLDLCSTFLVHMEADALTPGATAEALNDRRAAHLEAVALTTIHKALAGKTPTL